jgi:hypothetical protein
MASALCVFANLFLVLYSAYFLIFVGMHKLFSKKVKYYAQWGLVIASALLLIVPIIMGYIMGKDGSLVPHNFEVEGIPVTLLAGIGLLVCGVLFDKSAPSKSSGSKGVKYQGRGKPTYDQVYKAAYSAARDSYFTLVDVLGGNGGGFAIVLKYNHSDANSKQAYLQRFKSLFAGSFSGYDLSSITISA